MGLVDEADQIWNRACNPFALLDEAGDRALRAVLFVHGQVMNGGVGSAVEYRSPDEIEAAIAGIPSNVPLERASEIHLTDAGGGALQWVLHAPSTNWSLQATLWPGSLHLFVHDADDDEEQLYRARATLDQEYYRRKYPLEAK